jgi:hypothetical protein
MTTSIFGASFTGSRPRFTGRARYAGAMRPEVPAGRIHRSIAPHAAC